MEHEKIVVATENEWSDRGGCEGIPDGECCSCGFGKAPSNDGGENRSCRHYNWNDPSVDFHKVTCENRSIPVAWNKGLVTGFYCEG